MGSRGHNPVPFGITSLEHIGIHFPKDAWCQIVVYHFLSVPEIELKNVGM